MRWSLLALAIAGLLVVPDAITAPKEKKKKKKPEKEEITQVLDLPPDPPSAISAETKRLVFFDSTLSAKGLLSAQTRDAVKSLLSKTKGSQIVKIRAFVAGSGDMRRIGTIVGEEFQEKRLPVPALSTIQVGALPLEGSQVALEAIATDRSVQNEFGLAFLSGHPAEKGAEATAILKALERQSIPPERLRRVTCFLNRVNDAPDVRSRLVQAFPKAAVTIVQTQRIASERFEECEAIAALTRTPQNPVVFDDVVPNAYARLALVRTNKVAMSSLQLAFRNDDGDVRTAFQRTDKALETVGSDLKHTVMANFYPLTRSAGDLARRIRFDFYPRENPPASTLLLFEGLPSLDANLGLEIIAAIP